MNKEIKKRIEIASCNYVERKAFVAGANFALQNQWLGVKEALPQNEESNLSENVIVRTDTGSIYYAYYHYYLKGWFSVDRSVRIDYVTHWMPIPILEGGTK